jgi:transcriptional regulator with XRE-family HTH domain
MMTAEHFAARLRELRLAKGWTQAELAQRVGVSQKAVARWEQGTREPSWANVVALADALGVSSEAFREEPAEQPPPKPGRPPKAKPEAPAPQAKPKRRKPQGKPPGASDN